MELENHGLPEYGAIVNHLKIFVQNVGANFSDILLGLWQEGLIAEGQYISFEKSQDAKKMVEDCILLSIKTAGTYGDIKDAISAYFKFMSVLQSDANPFFKQLIKKIEAKRRELYRELLFPVSGPKRSPPYQVFISYGRGETTNNMVDKIKKCLEQQALLQNNVFVDRSNLKPGDHWPTELVSALRTSPVFIAVLTKKYVSSHYCHGELYEALALGKSLFPVVLEDDWDKEIAGKPVREILGKIQCVSLRSEKDAEKNLHSYVKSIVTKLGVVTDQPSTPTAGADTANGKWKIFLPTVLAGIGIFLSLIGLWYTDTQQSYTQVVRDHINLALERYTKHPQDNIPMKNEQFYGQADELKELEDKILNSTMKVFGKSINPSYNICKFNTHDKDTESARSSWYLCQSKTIANQKLLIQDWNTENSVELVPFYRYYNMFDHFYTINIHEIGTTTPGVFGRHGYKSEGVACYIYDIQVSGSIPLYRYWNGRDHFYTTNSDEIGTYVPGVTGKYGYKSEGIAGYCFPNQGIKSDGRAPLYRAYNGDHFYTTDTHEKDRAVNGGYTSEGIACYVGQA